MGTNEDLHVMVGEIRSDVKQLLKRNDVTEKRVASLEKRWWTTLAAVGLLVPVTLARALGWH